MAFASTLLVVMSAAYVFSQATPTPTPTKETQFTDHTAALLLDQFGAGLAEHSQKKALGAFDFAKMSNGPLFRQQILAFLAQTGNVRVHFNIVGASMQGDKGVVEADWQMDAEVREVITPPVRKQARLRFVAENTPAGWKLTDVQPRGFFSTRP
jgi:hypothetical protein